MLNPRCGFGNTRRSCLGACCKAKLERAETRGTQPTTTPRGHAQRCAVTPRNDKARFTYGNCAFSQ